MRIATYSCSAMGVAWLDPFGRRSVGSAGSTWGSHNGLPTGFLAGREDAPSEAAPRQTLGPDR